MREGRSEGGKEEGGRKEGRRKKVHIHVHCTYYAHIPP